MLRTMMITKHLVLLLGSLFVPSYCDMASTGTQVFSPQEREAWFSALEESEKLKLESIFFPEWFEQLEDDTRLAYLQLASSLYDFATGGADSDPTDHYSGFGPLLLRTSFHMSGTYHQGSGMGGSNGGTIFEQGELNDDQNGCVNVATSAIQELFQGHDVPLADAVVIAGVVALDVMNFPRMDLVTVEGGREDVSHTCFRDRLPSADDDPMEKFMKLYGLSVSELVALIGGAHNFGSAHGKCTGYVGQWTPTPLSWFGPGNSPPTFFPDLLRDDWRWYEVCTFANDTVRYLSIDDPFANGSVLEEEHEEEIEDEDVCLVSNSVVPLICEEQAMRGCTFEDGWYGLSESPCDINLLQLRLKSDFFLKANSLMLPYAQRFANDAELLAEQFGIAYHKLTHLGLERCGMSGHGCEEGTFCQPGEFPGSGTCVLDVENYVSGTEGGGILSSDEDGLGTAGIAILFVLLGAQTIALFFLIFGKKQLSVTNESTTPCIDEKPPLKQEEATAMLHEKAVVMSSWSPPPPSDTTEC